MMPLWENGGSTGSDGVGIGAGGGGTGGDTSEHIRFLSLLLLFSTVSIRSVD